MEELEDFLPEWQDLLQLSFLYLKQKLSTCCVTKGNNIV